MGIRLKDLSKLGYRDNVARSLAVALVGKYCKHETKEQILAALGDILKNPEVYKNSEIWSKLAEHLSPVFIEKRLTPYDLLDEPLGYKTYGSKYIETLAKQQMNLAMRLPITLAGALMPDAHAGYGLPIGGVLATDHAVIPYALGVDIGCRMNLTLFDAGEDFLKRYSHHIKEALKEFTHFGMDGEFHLEESKQREWDCRGDETYLRELMLGVCNVGDPYPFHHEEIAGVTDDAADIVAEGESESEDNPQHAHEPHDDEALEHGRDDILAPHHASVEEREARGHHQHEDGGGDHPCHIGTHSR